MEFSITHIKETCIYSHNLDKTVSFYRDKLGLDCFAFKPNELAFFRAGNSVLLCFDPDYSKKQEEPPPHFAEGELHFAFEVPKEKYAQTKQLLIEKGVEIESEYHWRDDFYSLYFRDPDNHCVEFVPSGLWDY